MTLSVFQGFSFGALLVSSSSRYWTWHIYQEAGNTLLYDEKIEIKWFGLCVPVSTLTQTSSRMKSTASKTGLMKLKNYSQNSYPSLHWKKSGILGRLWFCLTLIFSLIQLFNFIFFYLLLAWGVLMCACVCTCVHTCTFMWAQAQAGTKRS